MRLGALFLAGALALSWSGPGGPAAVAAAGAKKTKPAPKAKAKSAADWYAKGAKHHAAGEYAEAASAYGEAFALDSDPVYLYNIATVHRLAGKPVEAATYYERYLADPAVPLRVEASARLAEMKALVAAKAPPPETKPAPATLPATSPVSPPVKPGGGAPGTAAPGVLAPASSPALGGGGPRVAPAPKRTALYVGLGAGAALLIGAAVAATGAYLHATWSDRFVARWDERTRVDFKMMP